MSDPAQVAVFDSVFRSVFGSPAAGDAFQPEQPQTAATAPDERVRTTGFDLTAAGRRTGRAPGPVVVRAHGRRT